MAPIQCGAKIRNRNAPDNHGTLGCVVVSDDRPGKRYLLSAAHVLGMDGHASPGDEIQACVGSDWVTIARFTKAIPFNGAEGAANYCDAAIAEIIDNDMVDPRIQDIGWARDVSSELFEAKRLMLRGAGTGAVQHAEIHSTGNGLKIYYEGVAGNFSLTFRGQVLYGVRSGASWALASRPMDSGALVLTADRLAVGLHIAKTPDDYALSASVCTPLGEVLSALNVRMYLEGGAESAGAPAFAPVVAPMHAPAQAPAAASPPAPAPAFAPGPVAAVAPAFAAAVAAPSVRPNYDELGENSYAMFRVSMRSLLEPHNEFGGVLWQLCEDGVIVGGRLEGTQGAMKTVPRIWSELKAQITRGAERTGVPLELIIATICTESGGRADAVRIEPGWVDDATTPARVSVGLMQTLISTAREATGNPGLDRQALKDPLASIEAGAAYIRQQSIRTLFDPPRVACAYNAGRLALNDGPANRWKMRQYPIGTGAHADRFVQWFNDCMKFFKLYPGEIPPAPVPGFARLFRGDRQ